MAPGSRCTGILLEMRPILPIAPKFAHPNSLIRKHFEDNYTLFRKFLDCIPQLREYSGAPVKQSQSTWELIAWYSAYLGASGSIWKDQCGCSELLSCLVMTSKPFYILLMKSSRWLKNGNIIITQPPQKQVTYRHKHSISSIEPTPE